MIPNFAQVKKVSLICCGQGFNREYQGHYNRYRVLIDGEPLENIVTKEELKSLGYWSPRSNVIAMTIWGSSQRFEAVIRLAEWMGLDSKDWPAFTRQAEEKIKEI